MIIINLPAEIFTNILKFLSIDDLIELYKTCKITNKYVYINLKCNICNLKINKIKDIYNFKTCHECKEIICKECQSFCGYEFCDNIYCDYCLVTEICEECDEYLKNSSNEEEDF